MQIGRAPRRIDIMTTASGLEDESAVQNKKIVHIEDIAIPVLGKDDLIMNKKAVGRAQDVADVESLERLGERDD